MKIIIIILLFVTTSQAKMYPILEEDFLLELEQYSKGKEFKNQIEQERNMLVDKIKSSMGEVLPPAKDNKSYSVSYSYKLEQDIPKVNRSGDIVGMLYPKGYTFNPLLYLDTPPSPLLIFNACNEKEKAFINSYRDNLTTDYMLVSSGCKLSEIKGIERQVYLLQKNMVKMFKLESTISVVSVDIKRGVFNVQIYSID